MIRYYTYDHDKNPNDRRLCDASRDGTFYQGWNSLDDLLKSYGDHNPKPVPLSCIRRLKTLPLTCGFKGALKVSELEFR